MTRPCQLQVGISQSACSLLLSKILRFPAVFKLKDFLEYQMIWHKPAGHKVGVEKGQRREQARKRGGSIHCGSTTRGLWSWAGHLALTQCYKGTWPPHASVSFSEMNWGGIKWYHAHQAPSMVHLVAIRNTVLWAKAVLLRSGLFAPWVMISHQLPRSKQRASSGGEKRATQPCEMGQISESQFPHPWNGTIVIILAHSCTHSFIVLPLLGSECSPSARLCDTMNRRDDGPSSWSLYCEEAALQ